MITPTTVERRNDTKAVEELHPLNDPELSLVSGGDLGGIALD